MLHFLLFKDKCSFLLLITSPNFRYFDPSFLVRSTRDVRTLKRVLMPKCRANSLSRNVLLLRIRPSKQSLLDFSSFIRFLSNLRRINLKKERKKNRQWRALTGFISSRLSKFCFSFCNLISTQGNNGELLSARHCDQRW